MKTIVIACSGGATSGLLGTKVIKEAGKIGIKGNSIWMVDLDNKKLYEEVCKNTDLLIIYGPAQAVTKKNINEAKLKNINIDYIFIAPQMRHLVELIKKDCNGMVGIEDIAFQDFGMMRGDKILNRIKEVVSL